MLNILIVESSKQNMERYTTQVQCLIKKYSIIKTFNMKKTMDALASHEIDLFFISLLSKEIDGIGIARYIQKQKKYERASIVFVGDGNVNPLEHPAGLHKYQTVTFDGEKFVGPNDMDILGAMLRTMCRMKYKEDINKGTKSLSHNKKVLLESGNDISLITLRDILYVESYNRLLNIFTKHGTTLTIRKTLNDFIDEIDDEFFVRCHKSLAVNILNVALIKPESSRLWRVWFREAPQGARVPCVVSKTYYEDIYRLLNKAQNI